MTSLPSAPQNPLDQATETALRSPLREVDPKSLDYIFGANPDELSDEDITRLCQELRKLRSEFTQAKQAKVKGAHVPVAQNVDELMDLLDLKKL
jgi:hypothetical protein